MDVGFDTPEEAARSGIPERLTKVVWCEQRGENAVVLLQVNDHRPYFDLSRCVRGPGGWVTEGSEGANGSERPEDFDEWLATFRFEDL